MSKRQVIALAKKAVSIVSSVCLVTALAPACALGDASSGSVSCGNGWVLTYASENGQATITGVETAGNGELVIPDTVGGSNRVVSIGTRAFYNASALKTISIPDTVETLANGAFFGSALTNVHIPASVKSFADNCFRSCTSLSSVTYAEGMTMDYMGKYAFADDTALTEFTIPPLVGKTPSNDSSIDGYCFSGCTNITTMTFLEGGKDNASNYFYAASCVNGCTNLTTLVFHCKKASLHYGINSYLHINSYYTVNFYNSEADAASKTNRVASVILPEETSIEDIAQGKVDASVAYAGSDAIPAAPSGKVWGFSDHAVTKSNPELDNTYNAIAVDPDDLDYGYFTSPEAESYDEEGTDLISTTNPNRASCYFLNEDTKTCDISDLMMYGPDFKPVDPSMYTISIKRYNGDYNKSLDKSTLGDVDGISEWGIYQVTATAKAPYTSAYSTDIFVSGYYYPSTSTYTLGSTASSANDLMDAGACALEEAPAFVVVAPSSDWRYGVIASGLAGVGDGFVVYSDSSDNDAMYRAITDSKTDAVNIVGSTSVVPASVESRIKIQGNMQNGGSVDRMDGSTPQEVALNVYNTIKRYGSSYGYSWGKTAVIVSSADSESASLAAQYAHEAKAPVFLTEANGSLSSSALSALKSGGFTSVIVAGSESVVSAATLTAAGSAAGVTAQRIAVGDSYQNASIAAAADVAKIGTASLHTVVVADGRVPVAVLAGSEYAALNGGQLITVSTPADIESLCAYIGKVGKRNIENLVFVGALNATSTDFTDYFDSYWSSGVVSSASTSMFNTVPINKSKEVPADTSTFKQGCCQYKITSKNTAILIGITGKTGSSLTINTVSYQGVTYKVTGITAGSLANSGVKSVTLGKNVAGFTAKFFAGCKSLKKCTLANTKLKSIPAQAFKGCKSLKTLVVKSTALKAAKVKKSLKGSSISTVKVPKSKVKAYKKIFTKKNCGKSVKVKK